MRALFVIALIALMLLPLPPVAAVKVLRMERVALLARVDRVDRIAFVQVPMMPVATEVQARGFVYRATMVRAAKRAFGSDAPVALLAAQVHVESAWQTGVCSDAGACGIAQFMPATARAVGELEGFDVDRSDPNWSLLAQAQLMADLAARHARLAPCDAQAFQLSEYNGGIKMLDAERNLAADPNSWASVKHQRVRKLSAWHENRAYVPAIQRLVTQYAAIGFPYRGPLCV